METHRRCTKASYQCIHLLYKETKPNGDSMSETTQIIKNIGPAHLWIRLVDMDLVCTLYATDKIRVHLSISNIAFWNPTWAANKSENRTEMIFFHLFHRNQCYQLAVTMSWSMKCLKTIFHTLNLTWSVYSNRLHSYRVERSRYPSILPTYSCHVWFGEHPNILRSSEK